MRIKLLRKDPWGKAFHDSRIVKNKYGQYLLKVYSERVIQFFYDKSSRFGLYVVLWNSMSP